MTKNDREVLRRLASEYMEEAVNPVQREKIALWKKLNTGRMERPMVAIDQLPWHELNGEGELTPRTGDPFWQGIETALRRELYKWRHFPVDMVLEPCVPVPLAVSGNHYGIVIAEDKIVIDAGNDVYSHRYQNQLRTMEDVGKIKDMAIEHDEALSRARLEEAREAFDGIAPVRAKGIQFHLGLWDHLSQLIGVEDIFFDLIDRPEFIHALMGRITEATLVGIDRASELGVHDDNALTCHCAYVFDDSQMIGPMEGKGPTAGNSWAYGMAQLFNSVSPETTAEFEIPYISKLAERFGSIYYGCCDRLDDRMEYVKRIPNLRKVSCSPWSDREAFAERVGGLVMSNKPTPAFLAEATVDWGAARADLERTIEAARRGGANLELILKDLSTVLYDPSRLTRWANMAMELMGGAH